MANFKSTIDKIKVLNTKGLAKSQKQLVYPLDITGGKTLGHYVLFNINRISGSSYGDTTTQTVENPIQNPLGKTPVVYGSKSGSISKYAWARHVRSNESIVLCMPESITTNYGVGWNGSELGLAGMGAQFLSRAAQDMSQFKLGDALNVGKEMGRFAATKAIQSASEAIPFLPTINAHDTLELFTGTMTNPYVEMISKGCATEKSRSHSNSLQDRKKRRKWCGRLSVYSRCTCIQNTNTTRIPAHSIFIHPRLISRSWSRENATNGCIGYRLASYQICLSTRRLTLHMLYTKMTASCRHKST